MNSWLILGQSLGERWRGRLEYLEHQGGQSESVSGQHGQPVESASVVDSRQVSRAPAAGSLENAATDRCG